MLLSLNQLLTVPIVLALASVAGMCRSMDMIVRQSVLPEIVGEEKLQNGVALSRTGRDFTQIIGPVCGGILMEMAGTTYSYVVIVLLYATSLLLIARVKGLPDNVTVRGRDSVIRNVQQGISYVRSEKIIMGLLIIAFIVNFTAFPMNNTLLAVVAKDIMNRGATSLGWLMGAYSFGSLLGSLTIGSISSMGSAGRVMVVGSVLWHVGILVMAYMKWFYPALPVLVLTGMSQAFAMVTMAMMILKYTATDMRGRVLGLRQLAVYGLPIGLLLSGYLAERNGVFSALIVNGVVGLVLLALSLMKWPGLLVKRKS